MENRQQYHINISAPNLVNICVDQSIDDEMSGRLYHCYEKDYVKFSNSLQLIKLMESLFDQISFPQSSTESRYFVEPERKMVPKPAKVADQEEIIAHTGKAATFVVYVQFRQKATWQGEVTWVEQKITKQFVSTLEFIKLLDNALAVLSL